MSDNRIAVVGASGVVGREVIVALGAKDHPGEAILALATGRTDGEEIDFEEETLPVEKVDESSFRGIKAAVLAVPSSAAKGLADQARKAGAWVIDLSGAYSSDAAVPLVAPGIGAATTDSATARIVALAHPLAQALALVLAPLRTKGLNGVDATALVGAAAYGQVGVRMLEQQTASLLGGRDPEPGPFPHRLAFNVIPHVGTFSGPRTSLEGQVRAETEKLLGAQVPLNITALAVPTFHSGMLSVTAHLDAPISAETARELLKSAAEIKVLDDPQTGVYPMPMLVTGDAQIHVGRVRVQGKAVQLVIAVDLVGRAADSAATLALTLAARG